MRQTLACGVLALLSTMPAWGQQLPGTTGPLVDAKLAPLERFNGPLLVPSGARALRSAHVSLQTWTIYRGEKVSRFPLRGFTLFELRAGKAATVINGVRQERKTGDFWTVAAGATMSFEPMSEAASLQTLTIQH